MAKSWVLAQDSGRCIGALGLRKAFEKRHDLTFSCVWHGVCFLYLGCIDGWKGRTHRNGVGLPGFGFEMEIETEIETEHGRWAWEAYAQIA